MARPELALPSDLTVGGDDQSSGIDVESAFDDILGNFDMLKGDDVSTTDNDDSADADNAEEDDDLLDDESGDEEDEADGDDGTDDEVEDDDDDSDDDSTEDDDDEEGDDDDDADEIDWDFKVPVKVDGEEAEVDLGEIVKGYQTSQHLSKKGRELANERKEFETQKQTEMEALKESAKVLSAQNMAVENTLASEYTELQAELKAAKKDGDKYKQEELQEEMEEIQSKYWTARKTREKVEESLKTQEETEAAKRVEADMAKFNEEIGDYVPDFNEEKATAIREFALSKGIPEEVLGTLIDARIIGAINEFMELDQKVTKGSAKRKKAPKRTPSQTKKTRPTSEKRKAARKETSKRIQSGEADESDVDGALDALVGKYF